MSIEVRTQAKLDRALADHPDELIVLVGDGTFTFRGSSSPRVVARGSSSPRGSVGRWAHMTVLSHGPTVDIPGAHILAVPEIVTPADWCDYHGATVRDDGTVVLFKAVDNEYRSGRGMVYAPGSTPEAPDWDPGPECGGGLHFCASPAAALLFQPDAARFVACPVALDEIVVHPNAAFPQKVKAPRVVAPCWEVTIDGEPIDQEVTA